MAQQYELDWYWRFEASIERSIRIVQRRQRLVGADAEDFAQDARLHLIRNGCRALRRFRGQAGCRLETYLHIIFRRMLVNLGVRERGRWRASARARRLGVLAVKFERMVARDGLTIDAALAILATDDQSRAQLLACIPSLQLDARPRTFVQGLPAECPAPSRPGQEIDESEVRTEAARVRAALRKALAALPRDDRALLEKRYAQGLTVGAIAEAANVTRRQMYGRYDGIHARLRRSLAADGIDPATVIAIVDAHAFDAIDGDAQRRV